MVVACSTNVKHVKLVTCSDITRTFVGVVILKRPFIWMLEDGVAITSSLTCSYWAFKHGQNMTAGECAVSLDVHLTSLLVVGEGKRGKEREREGKGAKKRGRERKRGEGSRRRVRVVVLQTIDTGLRIPGYESVHGSP